MVYGGFGMATGFVCRTDDVAIFLWSAGLMPLIPFGLGMVVGARREAGSWSRLIGVDAADWIARTSQHSRWAGFYLGPRSRPASGVMAALTLSGRCWPWTCSSTGTW